jgi:hypothetical protein
MVALGMPFGPRTPETLIEEVGRLPDMVRELELSTARRAVHQILAMIELHYQGWTARRYAAAGPQESPMTSATSWNRIVPPSLTRWPTPP